MGVPAPSLLTVMVGVLGFLGCCSALCFAVPALRRPEARSVRRAINGWWPPALLCWGAALVGWAGLTVLFAGVSAWTLREFLRLCPRADRDPLTRALAYLIVPVHYATVLAGWPTAFTRVWLVGAFAILPLARVLARGPAGLLGALGRLQLGVALTVFALSHVASLARFGPRGLAGVGPVGYAALLLVCVMVNDGFQYVFGKRLGRHPLAPAISPKKTWEGLAGGALATAGVAALAGPLLTPFTRGQAAVVGLALALLGVLGDLFVSAIKRDVGVKDTGAVLPGQGGLLDRCDSLLLAAPAFAWALEAWCR